MCVLGDCAEGENRRNRFGRPAAEVDEAEDARVDVGPPGPIPWPGRTRRRRRRFLATSICTGTSGEVKESLRSGIFGREREEEGEGEQVAMEGGLLIVRGPHHGAAR